MQAVQVVSRGQAEFVQTGKPAFEPGHVLVRPVRLALCGSDIQMLHYAAEREYPFPPGTTGHEMVGYVEAVDANDPDLRVGDRELALAPGHRAMAEFFLAKREHVLPLPGDMNWETLLQAQQFGTVIYACKRLPDVTGMTVAVVGQGSAGLWFNYHLRSLGAERVVAMDIEPFRLERSVEFGATDTICNQGIHAQEAIRDVNEGRLPDLVVEAAGETDSINLAVHLARNYGDILYFGYPRDQVFSFEFDQLFCKCLRATAVVGASIEGEQASTRTALDLIANGKTPAGKLITHRFPFKDVLEAYDFHHRRRDGAVKIVIEMPD